jgi:hypothetical protein
MQAFRDGAAIRAAVTSTTDAELADLIACRVQEISDYEVQDLGELAHLFVIEPGDTLQQINHELGFALPERPIDIIETHAHWFEITIVLRDDGFGVVLYVPVLAEIDPDLLTLCRSRAAMQGRP